MLGAEPPGAGGQVRRTCVYKQGVGDAPQGHREREKEGGSGEAAEDNLTSLKGHPPEPEVLAPTPPCPGEEEET